MGYIEHTTSMKRNRTTVIDLYAGAGGLSAGLRQAGFDVVAAVERDRWACMTYRLNHADTDLWEVPLSELPPDFYAKYQGVDVVAGGPPCQGFSISASHRRNTADPRNDEIFAFLHAALRLRPRCILLENVPEIARFAMSGEMPLVDKIVFLLQAEGFDVRHWLIDCADFGLPQRRRRFFLRASKSKITDMYAAQTHFDPLIYKGPTWKTVDAAIGDLPPVKPRELTEDAWLVYSNEPFDDYQATLRSKQGGFFNHIPMRHSPRLISRFAEIPSGGNGALVWSRHPANARSDRSQLGVNFHQNHRRLFFDRPSPTITAQMYSTCLHPTQDRNITVREAARLQSFPDSYRFLGKRTTLSAKLLERKGLIEDMGLNQLNQVGNAVPPIVACALGRVIREDLSECRHAKCA